jgi:subtilisin family serine protease
MTAPALRGERLASLVSADTPAKGLRDADSTSGISFYMREKVSASICMGTHLPVGREMRRTRIGIWGQVMSSRFGSRGSRILIGLLAMLLLLGAASIGYSYLGRAASPAEGPSTVRASATASDSPEAALRPPRSPSGGSDGKASVAEGKVPLFDKDSIARAKPERVAVPSVVEIILQPGKSAADVAELGTELGFKVTKDLVELSGVVIESLDGEPIPDSVIERLRSSGIAGQAAPTVRVYPLITPSDPRYVDQWGFKNAVVPGADINAEPAWDWARGHNTVVAIVDTGVMLDHPDLAGQAWSNTDEIPGNLVDDDGNGYVDDINGWDFHNGNNTVWDEYDNDLHGTHVAGTIAAAANNGEGGVGTAWNTKLMVLKVLGENGGTSEVSADAIRYAVNNGADVINCSWGGYDKFPGSPMLNAAFDWAAQKGVLIVTAAGNEGFDNDVPAPGTNPAENWRSYPASIETTNNITVAWLNQDDTLDPGSNYGATSVDLGAPGGEILSSRPYPTVAASRVETVAAGGTAPYSLFYYAFAVERVSDAAARDAIISYSIGELAPSKSAAILVVNDSWNAWISGDLDYTAVYTAALAAAGYTNVQTWDTYTQSTPNLAGYDAVIWFTGKLGLPAWPALADDIYGTDLTTIGGYLNAGGNMLLSSPQVASDYDNGWFAPSDLYGNHARWWFREYTQCLFELDWHEGDFVGKAGGPFSGLNGTTALTEGDQVVAHRATPLLYWVTDDKYVDLSGTSMATPHVTGAIALAWSRTPGATAAGVRQRLMDTTVKIPALTGKCLTEGRLDAAAFVGETAPPASLWAAATGAHRFQVGWTDDHTDAYFSRTKVLAKQGSWPAGPNDGSAKVVHDGTAETALATNLAAGAWYVAAYSQNSLGSWTSASTTQVEVGAIQPGNMMWWENKSPIPVAAKGRSAAAVGGKIYLLGGGVGSGTETRVDCYDPGNDTWTSPYGTMAASQQGLGSGLVYNGLIYLVGAQPYIVVYNPSNGASWTLGPIPARPGGRSAIVENAWGDGAATIYIAGGGGSNNVMAVPVAADGSAYWGAYYYTLPAEYTQLRSASVFASGGYLYIAGGENGSGFTAQTLKMATRAWQCAGKTEGSFEKAGSLPVPRLGQSAQPFSNGRFYLATGSPYVDTMEFDPTAGPLDSWGLPVGSWSVVGTIPTPRVAAAAASYDDYLYCIGGVDENGLVTNINEVGHLVPCTDVFADAHGVPLGGGEVQATVDGGLVKILFPPGQAEEGPLTIATMTKPPKAFPGGFNLNGTIYEISSGAQVAYPVKITLPYTASGTPVILHWNGTKWEAATWDVPGGGPATRQGDVQILSYGGGEVTFLAWSMSPFAAGEAEATPPQVFLTPASSWWSLVLVVVLAGALMAPHLRRRRQNFG